MKFKITAYKPNEGEPDYPDEMARARDLVLMSVAPLMQLHGISKLQANAVRIGPQLVKSPQLLPVEDPGIPGEIKILRNNIARSLVDILLSYGIHDVEILPSEEEDDKIRKRWKFLREGDQEEPV